MKIVFPRASLAAILVAASILAAAIGATRRASATLTLSPIATPMPFTSPMAIPTTVPRPLINDALPVPGSIHAIEHSVLEFANPAGPGPLASRTSDYMLGKVAVAVILPESDGSLDPSTEDWTPDEIAKVRQEVLEGLDWWRAKAQEHAVSLDFVVPTPYPQVVQTKYEPISRPGGRVEWGGDEPLWIDDVMSNMGYNAYPPTQYLIEARSFDHALRVANGADWGVTIFVVDSSHDVDPATQDPTPGLFSNWISGYAWVAGPHLVVTRDNDGWEFDHLGEVLAHELGHVFGAPDEAPADWSCKDGSSCQLPFGYLSVPNQNCNHSACMFKDDKCMMRAPLFDDTGNHNTTCLYTVGHVGWRDTNSNGLPDPVDTSPELTITGWPTSPSSSHILAYVAQARDVPYMTQQADYESVSINTVTVEYQLNSTTGAWLTAIPADGAWDSPTESGFRNPVFVNGTYTVYIRACNEVGRTSPVSSRVVTVDSADPVYKVQLPFLCKN